MTIGLKIIYIRGGFSKKWHEIFRCPDVVEGNGRFRIIISISSVMAIPVNDPSSIKEKLRDLEQQYDKALHAGEKFSVLKDIRDQINQLLQQLPLNGNGTNHNGNEH